MSNLFIGTLMPYITTIKYKSYHCVAWLQDCLCFFYHLLISSTAHFSLYLLHLFLDIALTCEKLIILNILKILHDHCQVFFAKNKRLQQNKIMIVLLKLFFGHTRFRLPA